MGPNGNVCSDCFITLVLKTMACGTTAFNYSVCFIYNYFCCNIKPKSSVTWIQVEPKLVLGNLGATIISIELPTTIFTNITLTHMDH